jgi:hypothetical protein
MIHPPGIWDCRPKPTSDLHNLVLCGDYVQNPMDLATMEGANSSARLAVNALLDAMDHDVRDRVPVVGDYQREHVPRSLRMVGRTNDLAFQRGRARGLPDPVVTPHTLSEPAPDRDRAVDLLQRAGRRLMSRAS